jgi:hypothetical protein
MDLYDTAHDGAVLSETVRVIWNSHIPGISTHGQRALEEALEWAMADLYGWENVEYAEEVLKGLGDLVPDEARQTIEDAYDKESLDWLEAFEDLGQFGAGRLDTIRQMLHRAERQVGYDERISKAWEAVRQAESGIGHTTLDAPKNDSVVPQVDTEVQIAQMLAALRRP